MANRQEKEPEPGLGIYEHVPFCVATCDFCAFYQRKPHGDDFARYLEGVEAEWRTYPEALPVQTVFWGGGTPGMLGPRELTELGRGVLARCGAGRPVEWSVEMAPALVTERKLAALRDLGVNRISLGVQSFQEGLLEKLGRQHTREEVFRGYERVRAAGFANVNLDLIVAIPGQDRAALQEDLEQAVALGPDHLSTYCLTFEEDTALFVRLAEGKVRIDREGEAERYREAWEFLEGAGYGQYEVSNFARPGKECIHNINTWRMGSWIGLGPAASSQWRGQRWTNVPDLERWRAGLEAGRPERVEAMAVDEAVLAADALVFGLRMNAGVDWAGWRARFTGCAAAWGVRLEAFWEDAAEEGLLEPDWRRSLRLSLRGRLVADRIGVEILRLTGKEEESAGRTAG